jgi:hypothetical protein
MPPLRLLAPGLAAAALAACGGAEPQPSAPPPAPSAVAAASAVAPGPRLGLLDGALEEAPSFPAPGPVTAYPGRFVAVPLPAGMPAIVAVVGLGSDDVWMLAASSAVLHWDGARVSDQGRPGCFADRCCGQLVDCPRDPRGCSDEGVAACEKHRADCAMRVDFDSLRVERGAVVVGANVYTGGLTANVIESRRQKDGRWSCEQPARDRLLRVGTLPLSPSLRLETSSRVLGNQLGETSVVAGERRVLLPDGLLHAEVSLAARADDDLWLWEPASTSPRLWHGNGMAWFPVATGLRAQDEVWITAPASLWALGVRDGEVDESLLRLDLDQGTWERFPAAGASRMLRAAGAGFWLLGEKVYHHWDGRALRRLEAPLAMEDPSRRVWLGPAGELWVVGGSPTATVKGPSGDLPAAAAFRLPPESRP